MSAWTAFKHLLPRSRAWSMVKDRPLTQFLQGLTLSLDAYRAKLDTVWLDVFPQDTTQLVSWEKQWALRPGQLTEQERRDRLAAVWQERGAQGPEYIEDALQAQGFAVFVHEWWDLTAWGVPAPKDPRDHLLPVHGGTDTDGFLISNLINVLAVIDPIGAGEDWAQAGEDRAVAGYFAGYLNERETAVYVGGVEKHPFYLYIGGQTFPDTVTIPVSRRVEFERAVRAICPAQQWLVLRVEYV